MTATGDSRAPTVVMPGPGARTPSAAIAQRSEFVRAFVEYAGDKPAAERLTVRWPTLITVTALVAVGAVVVGIFWNLIDPLQPGEKGAKKKAVPKPAVTSWTAVAGWDCTAAADRGFEAEGRTGAWRTVAGGGWAADGCHGTYQTLPATAGARPQTATWWFAPPAGLRSCRLDVFLPLPGDGVNAGYRPAPEATYSVRTGIGGTAYADFTVEHRTAAGDWVNVGTFPVHQNRLAVGLSVKDNEDRSGRRLVLAQMRATCAV